MGSGVSTSTALILGDAQLWGSRSHVVTHLLCTAALPQGKVVAFPPCLRRLPSM